MDVMVGSGELAARWAAKVVGVIAVVVACGVEEWWEEGVGRCLVVDGVGVAIVGDGGLYWLAKVHGC